MTPAVEMAELPVHVPPPGVAENVCKGKVLQEYGTTISDGVRGLLIVTAIVWVVAQVTEAFLVTVTV
jgi:hypothetical protein